jgi:hypothetical protein
VTPKTRPEVPTPGAARVVRSTADVDEEQQPLCESAVGDNLPDIALPDVLLPEAHPDGSVGEE